MGQQAVLLAAFSCYNNPTRKIEEVSGNRLPHITLGKTMTRQQIKLAADCMIDQFQPLMGSITRIGLSRVNPHEDISIYSAAEKRIIKA